MGLPKVVPRDDLDVVRLMIQGQNLLPAMKPEIIAPPQPVLTISGHVRVEPGRYRHHIW